MTKMLGKSSLEYTDRQHSLEQPLCCSDLSQGHQGIGNHFLGLPLNRTDQNGAHDLLRYMTELSAQA